MTTPLQSETRRWDATETAARIQKGEISRAEAVEAAIARALEWAELNAVVHPMWDAARAQAAQPGDGCFAGVPTFVKDLEDLAGAPTRFGSAAIPGASARATAPSVAQFLETGVISLGKSTTAEFGLTATTEPAAGEPTRNPWNLAHSAGGSSGGAGALVAAGVVPIAHGGDGGGSIRIPAAFNGLVGLKASRGRLVPMATSKHMPVKIATYGVLTRTLRDTARFYAEVERRRPAKGMPPIGEVSGPGRARLRIGLYLGREGGPQPDPAVREATLAAARSLESFGHRVEPLKVLHEPALVEDFLLHWALLAQGVEGIVGLTRGGQIGGLEPWTRGLARMARRRLHRVPGAIWRLRRYPRSYARLFETCDAVLSPTTASPAPPIGHLSVTQPFEQKLERLMRLLPYTPVQNASGGPAISLPLATSPEGLPIGVQLAGPVGHERRLLELAWALLPEPPPTLF